jgi:hypothetical protein
MDTNKIMIFQNRKADLTTAWLLFIFLGWSYGYLGKIGLQILYYLTLGGFGIWALVRLFTLSKDVKNYNFNIALQVGLTSEEMMAIGIY